MDISGPERYEKRRNEIQEGVRENTEQAVMGAWDDMANDNHRKALLKAAYAADKMRAWCQSPVIDPIFPLRELVYELAVEPPGKRQEGSYWDPEYENGLNVIEFAGEGYAGPVSELVWGEFVDRCFDPVVRLGKILTALEVYGQREYNLFEDSEQTHKIGEDFEESPLYEFWQKRRRQGRIVTAIIVARDGETGVGKTTLGVALCKEFDDDWTDERATNRPWEYRGLVQSEPKGSVLLADEFATMFDARRSMSSGNVESSQDWQMLRKLEVSTVGTCPSMADVDRRFLRLMDLQFLVTRRGHARVYKMKINDDDGSLYREHMCNVEWPDLSDDDDYQAVETMKEERLSERLGGDDDRDDQDDEPSDELRREVRNEMIRQLVEEGVTQADVAEALDLSPSAVSRIVNE